MPSVTVGNGGERTGNRWETVRFSRFYYDMKQCGLVDASFWTIW